MNFTDSPPSSRSNPGTPTQVRRPDFIYVANQQQQQQQAGLNYYDFPMHQQQQNPMLMHQQSQPGLPPYTNGSPQRRFLSEGELLSRNGLSNELSYVNRNNNTVDNIRELAGSPQRGVYNWKDNSPPGFINPNQMPMGATAMYSVAPGQQIQAQPVNTSNNQFMGRPPLPTSQQQQQQYLQNQNMIAVTSAQQQIQQQPGVRQSNVSSIINNIVANSANASSYHPALRGGVQVFPPQVPASPQVKRKQTPTRPISFVRALEMANSIEMTNTNYQQSQQQGEAESNKSASEMNPSVQQTQQIVDRGSIYDTNYEISV
jgi:palmitoyltransferase ZDHHC5/8